MERHRRGSTLFSVNVVHNLIILVSDKEAATTVFVHSVCSLLRDLVNFFSLRIFGFGLCTSCYHVSGNCVRHCCVILESYSATSAYKVFKKGFCFTVSICFCCLMLDVFSQCLCLVLAAQFSTYAFTPCTAVHNLRAFTSHCCSCGAKLSKCPCE